MSRVNQAISSIRFRSIRKEKLRLVLIAKGRKKENIVSAKLSAADMNPCSLLLKRWRMLGLWNGQDLKRTMA